MAMIVADDAVQVTKGTLKCWTRSSDSGRPVKCFFCADCGNRIFHQAEVYKGYTNVRPGTLDDTSWLKPTASIWMSSKQPWVEVPEGLYLHDHQPQ